jgi:hypothetical protein
MKRIISCSGVSRSIYLQRGNVFDPTVHDMFVKLTPSSKSISLTTAHVGLNRDTHKQPIRHWRAKGSCWIESPASSGACFAGIRYDLQLFRPSGRNYPARRDVRDQCDSESDEQKIYQSRRGNDAFYVFSLC